jgi:hypothetical protein
MGFRMAAWIVAGRKWIPLLDIYCQSQSVLQPTGRANARPMTGSVETGSRKENASK